MHEPLEELGWSPPLTFEETFRERWARRLITGPGLLALTPVYFAALPGTLAVTAALDRLRGAPWTATRFCLALGANLAMHVAGFGAVGAAWLVGGRWAGAEPERELGLEQKIQVWWAQTTWEASGRLYRMRLDVEETACLSPGPLLLLCRHTSLLDTLLPILVAARHDLRLRFVMKRELLWDPCLDAIGHRWPTAFVRRGTHDPIEIEHVLRLADGLGQRDGVVLYPEGTRFSKEKRDRVLASIERKHPDAYSRAARLRHVLPPHPGGVLALLERHPELDVAFFAHTGLEGANHFKDLLSGALLDTKVKGKLWRVVRADIPKFREAQIHWLEDEWARVDRWVAANRENDVTTD